MSDQNGGGDDHTGSSTDIASSSSLPDYEKLLGSRPLRKGSFSDSLYLVKMPEHRLSSDLEKVLNLATSPARSMNEMWVILGPISGEQIKAHLSNGNIRSQDVMLKSFDRWKSCKSFFPDLPKNVFAEEDTGTNTDTSSASGLKFDSTQTESEGIEIQGESFVDPERDAGELVSFKSQGDEALEVELPAEETSFEVDPVDAPKVFDPIHRNEVFSDRKAQHFKNSSNQVPPKERVSSPIKQKYLEQNDLKSQSTRPSLFTLFLLGLVILGGAYIFWQNRQSGKSLPLTNGGSQPDDKNIVTPQSDIPVKMESKLTEDTSTLSKSLKPLSLEQVYQVLDGDENIVKRIRGILNAYRLKRTPFFEREDEEFLQGQSQAGSASLLGQELALNGLAVHYIDSKDSPRALKMLEQFVDDENSLDSATHLNLAISMYESGENYERAKRFLSTADREVAKSRVPPVFPSALHALYKIKSTSDIRAADVEKDFITHEKKFQSNPLFYGLWIRALQKIRNPPKDHIQELLMKALWADLDRVHDSSFDYVPIARQWFVREAFAGLSLAAEAVDSRLTQAQKKFVKEFVAMRSQAYEFPKISQKDLARQLDVERVVHPLSALLFAYLKKEEGDIEVSYEAMQKLFKDPEKNKYLGESSYAYSFAGELASYLGKFQDATVYFDLALKNEYESSALWGKAMLTRESIVRNQVNKGSEGEVEAYLAGSLSADSSFFPALLRRERLTWRERAGIR